MERLLLVELGARDMHWGILRLPQHLLKLLHFHPPNVGQLPHGGKLLKECLQRNFTLKELFSHYLE